LPKQQSIWSLPDSFPPPRVSRQDTTQDLNDAPHQQASDQSHRDATSVCVQVAMKGRIIPAEIIQHFEINENIRQYKR
jgi:hypothetical protein